MSKTSYRLECFLPVPSWLLSSKPLSEIVQMKKQEENEREKIKSFRQPEKQEDAKCAVSTEKPLNITSEEEDMYPAGGITKTRLSFVSPAIRSCTLSDRKDLWKEVLCCDCGKRHAGVKATGQCKACYWKERRTDTLTVQEYVRRS